MRSDYHDATRQYTVGATSLLLTLHLCSFNLTTGDYERGYIDIFRVAFRPGAPYLRVISGRTPSRNPQAHTGRLARQTLVTGFLVSLIGWTAHLDLGWNIYFIGH